LIERRWMRRAISLEASWRARSPRRPCRWTLSRMPRTELLRRASVRASSCLERRPVLRALRLPLGAPAPGRLPPRGIVE